MSRVGIYGGSFNPVHHGHLALAEYALSELNLDKVYFVPAFQNPLKKSERASPDDGVSRRIPALKKAIGRNPRFILSDIELKRKGLSYTVDTLRAFKKKLGKSARLYFLAGADQIRHFSRWKSKEEILKLCRFVIATRPGHSLKLRDGRFLWLPMPPVDISSTQIRQKKGLK